MKRVVSICTLPWIVGALVSTVACTDDGGDPSPSPSASTSSSSSAPASSSQARSSSHAASSAALQSSSSTAGGSSTATSGSPGSSTAGASTSGGTSSSTESGPDLLAAVTAARAAIQAGQTAIDLNGDGVTDYQRTLDQAGNLVKEEIDIDQDGTADMVWDYSGETRTFREDRNHDGTPERRWDVTADADNPAIVTYVHGRDTNADGRVDYQLTYTVDPSDPSITLQIEEDVDFDGTFDWEEAAVTTRVQHGSLVSVSTTGPTACTPDKQAKLEEAFNNAVKNASSCLNRMDSGAALDFLRTIAGATFKLGCVAGDGTYCGEADVANAKYRWFGKDELPINITDEGFGNPGCGSLEATIFHEIMHYVAGLHEIGDGTGDPADPVYGCEKACYGGGNSQDCAACLGARQGDSRCKHFPQKPCTDPAPAYCPCGNPRMYDSATLCAVGCPSGLGCFASRCKERGPCRGR